MEKKRNIMCTNVSCHTHSYVWLQPTATHCNTLQHYSSTTLSQSNLIHTRHDFFYAFICATWLIHMCDMTHSCVWHDSLIWVTWLIHMCDMTHSYVWHDSFIGVTGRIHMCDMTHSYLFHDSSMCVAWRLHMCDITHSYSKKDPFTCVAWLIRTHDILQCIAVCGSVLQCIATGGSLSYLHVTHVIESRHTHEWVMSHVYLSHITQANSHRRHLFFFFFFWRDSSWRNTYE